MRKFQPMWFVAENVGGLASANEGAAFKKILASMKDAGYCIYPHLYKFEEYGVPQSRHRIIIVGIRADQPFQFFPPSPAALEPRDNSARAALEDPPIPKDAANNERLQTFPDAYLFTGSKESVRKQIEMAVPPRAQKALKAVLICCSKAQFSGCGIIPSRKAA